MKKQVAVIGAGVGGLAAAIRLQSRGFQVTVFESNAYPGGKLTDFNCKGFRFDAGPSLFTLPEEVVDLLHIDGSNFDFDYERLDEVCRYFYEDGTVLKGHGDIDEFSKEVQEVLGVEASVVKKHLEKSAFIYNTTNKLFLQKSLHKITTYLSWNTFKSFLKLPFLGINITMDSANSNALKHPKLVQLFNRYATYNGSDPYSAPAVLNIIPHLEFGKGAFFPKEGMVSITESLFNKAKLLGVQFKFNTKVEAVNVVGKQLRSVVTNCGEVEADFIVSNMDVAPFYKHVLKRPQLFNKVLKQERSSSALIFYWGIKKQFDNLILHNIFFSADYKKEFECLFETKTLYHDPTVYVNITKKHKGNDAPEGCENWFVMINAPANIGQNWEELIHKAKSNILSKLSRILGEDVGQYIETENLLTPQLIEQKTSSYQGSLYGTSSNSKMAAFFRHPNFSKDIDNLYFVGGSVHPGGGIPLALSSAKIVSNLIHENE